VLKISDRDYFLPTIEALVPGDVLITGATQPNVIRGICEQTQSKGDYVVKFRAAQRMSPEASARELLAAFIAMELDFNVPAPAIINISSEFAELLRGQPNFQVANNSLGYNFGNEYMKEGYQMLIKGQKVPNELFGRLQDLFAFDILISNADRRVDKPNFLTNGKQELIFDHELAFGFSLILPSFRNHEPWLIKDSEMEWIRHNYCYNLFKPKNLNFATFVAKFDALNQNFWEKALSLIPSEWKTSQLNDIRMYIEVIMQNKDVFSLELTRILK
jgi:hypothetical protein